jgi:hypothetical protein
MIVVLLGSIFVVSENLRIGQLAPEFFVGVELAYSNPTFEDVKDLVDKVKDYTNLFVIGSPGITFNHAMLNQTCDYIYDAGLSFIVLFTDTSMYALDYKPSVWIPKAKQKYGDKFLAAYRYDEPGGRVLDRDRDALINQTVVGETANYSYATKMYVEFLYVHLAYYLSLSPSLFTADYGLYWFDYKGGYDTVLAEFGSNHSRELNVGLCRGAAETQGKDWGAIVTWKYTDAPYIESPGELYEDLMLAYRSGAKYVVVFDYPKVERYGILTEDHFDALKNFWDYARSNPQDHGVDRGEVAYVLPADYGFGFRSASDHVWAWDADDLSGKVWDDANRLVSRYGSSLDIVYDDSDFISAITGRYDRLFFWNETIP